MTDQEALSRLRRKGSEAAFEAVFQRHWPMTLGVCRRILENTEAAQDAAQATFIILHRKSRTLSSQVCLAGWLYKTAVTTSRQHRRDRVRREKQVESMKDLVPTATAIETDGPLWDELRPHIDSAVEALPRGLRDAFVLRFFEGKELKETALELGCAENTASQRISRALKKVRLALAKRGMAVSAAALSATLLELETSAANVTSFTELMKIINQTSASNAALSIAIKGMQIMFWKKCAAIAIGTVIVFLIGIGVVHSTGGLNSNGKPPQERKNLERIGQSNSSTNPDLKIINQAKFSNKEKNMNNTQNHNSSPDANSLSQEKSKLTTNSNNPSLYFQNMRKYLVEKNKEKRFQLLHSVLPVPRSLYDATLAKIRESCDHPNYPETYGEVRQLWRTISGDWAESDPRRAIFWQMQADFGEADKERTSKMERAFFVWGSQDPAGMTRFLEEHDPNSLDIFTREALNRCRELLDLDQDKIERILGLTSADDRPETIQRLLNHWAIQDLDAAIAWIEHAGENDRNNAIQGIIGVLARRNPNLAQSYVDVLPEKARENALRLIAGTICRTDPVAAIKLLSEKPGINYIPAQFQNAIRSWVSEDFEGAVKLLSNLDAKEKRNGVHTSLLTFIASRFANIDPARGEAFGKTLGLKSQETFQRILAGKLANHSPEQAFALIERNFPSEKIPATQINVLRQWASHAPAEALTWMKAKHDGESLDEATLSAVISGWSEKNPLEAMEYLKKEQLTQSCDPETIKKLAISIFELDAKQATDWIRQEASPEARKEFFLNGVIGRIPLSHSPAEGLRYLLDNVEEELRVPVLKKFAKTMGIISGENAFKRISETGMLDDDTLTHCHAAILIGISKYGDHRKTLTKASTLNLKTKDGDLRGETIRTIYANWLKKEPQKAEAWLEETECITISEKDELMNL